MKYLCLLLSIAALQVYGYGEHKKMCLGVKTHPLPEWAAEQMNLRYGEGLLIKHVLNNSPADKAGLYNNDIITKIDEQVVGTPQHLRDLICEKEALEKVTVSILRQGKPLSIDVTLERSTFDIEDIPDSKNHKNDLADHQEAEQKHSNPQAHSPQPGGSQQHLRQQMRQQMQAFQEQINQLLKSDSFESFADLKKHMQEDLKAFKAKRNQKGHFKGHSSSSFQFMDSEGIIKIETHNDKQTITIRDSDNNTLYQGAYPKNQEDWDNMDNAARERLLALDLKVNPETGLVTAQLAN